MTSWASHTGNGTLVRQGGLRGAADEGERHSARHTAWLPDDLVRRASGDVLKVAWLGDDIEAGRLGEDGAREAQDGGGDGSETHLDGILLCGLLGQKGVWYKKWLERVARTRIRVE